METSKTYQWAFEEKWKGSSSTWQRWEKEALKRDWNVSCIPNLKCQVWKLQRKWRMKICQERSEFLGQWT